MSLSLYAVIPLFGYALIILALYAVVCCAWNLLFHSLRSFPGPRLGRATRLHSSYIRATGSSEQTVLRWHQQYGPVVRIAPDELSFNSGSAWEDIYGIKNKRERRLRKDPHFYMGAIAPNGEKNLGAADDEDHSRIRSVLAHGFSDRALHAQESLLRDHVDHLVTRLRQLQGSRTNVVRWMHHIAYDIIAHLCFGQDCKALDHDGWYLPAKVVFEGIREGVTLVEILRFLPFKLKILNALVRIFGEARRKNFDASVSKATARLETGHADNVDFIAYILRAEDSVKQLTASELSANVCLLIDAGSETTATMLSGCFYNLAVNRACLKQLTSILRSEFKSPEELTIQSLSRIPYLHNVLQESLRVYPSLPATLPRITPPGGAIIDGFYVPSNVKVGVNQYATYMSPRNFHDPQSFSPERWEKTALPFKEDKRHVLQPFSMGSRGCLGKNLAWAEMKMIVGILLWHFDLELEVEPRAWRESQKTWFIWDKPDLFLRFKERDA